MGSSALSAAQLHRVRKELPRLEADIGTLAKHAELLTTLTLASATDARLLLKEADHLKVAGLKLRLSAQRLIPDAIAISRGPVDQDTRDIKAIVERLPARLNALDRSLMKFDRQAKKKLNEPGRWGDGSSLPESVAAGYELVNTVVEVLERLLSRRR